jgi:hypothetical protein
LFDAGQEAGERFRGLIGLAGSRIARMEMQDRRSSLGGRNRLGRNLIRRDRQVR